MRLRSNKNTEIAAKLRKNMTAEELKLWNYCLKQMPYKFRRQAVFGNYIVDFYCPAKKIVIEVDGSQHYTEEGEKKDKIRDKYFTDMGIRVVRYTNLEVNLHFRDVCDDIYAILSGEK